MHFVRAICNDANRGLSSPYGGAKTTPTTTTICEISPTPTRKPDDPSVEAVDVAVTGFVAPIAPTSSAITTADVAKAKVKKEVTAVERKVQNQKRPARRVAQQAGKGEAVTTALQEERRERLMRMAARA
jgi:hypothetical protein